jgi:hypothetical protein
MLGNLTRFVAAAIFFSVILPIQQAHAQAPTLCGNENSTCTVFGTQFVDAYYGANGRYAHRVVNANFNCNNATFGDPAKGFPKQCFIGQSAYSYRASEADIDPRMPTDYAPSWNYSNGPVILAYGTLQFPKVAWGLFGAGFCSNSTFGDPAPGYVKACYSSPEFAECARENGTCSVNRLTLVAYGARGIGPWVYKAVSGPVPCNNATFGDPAPGRIKSCFVMP